MGVTRKTPDEIGNHVFRYLGDKQTLCIAGALADEALPEPDFLEMAHETVVGIGVQQLKPIVVHLIDHAVLCIDERRKLGQQHPSDIGEIALALQHVGETSEVSFQPVLLIISLRRQTEITDHRVDIVLELSHLAARINLNRTGQITLGDGGRTSAIARTCVVRLAARRLTLPVKSFHVPAAPGTCA